jgi:Protein of unknown function (DUF3237)
MPSTTRDELHLRNPASYDQRAAEVRPASGPDAPSVRVNDEERIVPKLVQEFQYSADLVLEEIGSGPFGQRVIANVTGGKVDGSRIKATIVGAGADWLLVGPDGFGRLDVRATFKTHDGAAIYVQYHGIVEVTEDMAAILGGAGKSVGYGDQYFFTNPRLETGDERYQWVNRTQFLGEGRLVAGPTVEYRVYRVEND